MRFGKKAKIIFASALLALGIAGAGAGVSSAWFTNGQSFSDSRLSGSSIGAYFAYGNGRPASEGTTDSPYGITAPRHLYNLAWLHHLGYIPLTSDGHVDGVTYFELGADIDMTGMVIPPIGDEVHPFLGSLDGQGYTISNLTVANSGFSRVPSSFSGTSIDGVNDVGFFGYVGSSGTCSDLYLEGLTISLGAESATTSSEADDHATYSHDHYVYCGYLAGHTVYAGNFQNVYCNNCTIEGDTVAGSSVSNASKYGYFGRVEYTGTSSSGGSKIGGTSYSFDLDPAVLYDAIDTIYTDHGSDYLVTRNRSTNYTVSDATLFSSVISETNFSQGNTDQMSECYRIGGREPPKKTSEETFSLSTIGYYGAGEKTVSLGYGDSHTALPTDIVSTSLTPEETTSTGNYLYYDSTNWNYFHSTVTSTSSTGQVTYTGTFNVFYFNNYYSSSHYLSSGSSNASIAASTSESTSWCFLSAAEAATLEAGITEDTTFGVSSVPSSGSYYLYNPSTGRYLGAISSSGSLGSNLSTVTSISSAGLYTVSQYSGSVIYLYCSSGYYLGYRRSNLYSATRTGSYYRWTCTATSTSTTVTNTVTDVVYSYERVTDYEYDVYYTEDSSTWDLLTQESPTFSATYQTATVPDTDNANVYVADTSEVTASGYNAKNIDICGGIYFGLDSSSNYCVGFQGYSKNGTDSSGNLPSLGAAWYPDAYVCDSILLYIVNTNSDSLGSIAFEWSASGNAPSFYKRYNTSEATSDIVEFSAFGDNYTEEEAVVVSGASRASVELTSTNVKQACLCALDSEGNVYAYFDESTGEVTSCNETSVDDFDESKCYQYVLDLCIVDHGIAFVYDIDFQFEAIEGNEASDFAGIVEYRSASDTSSYIIVSFSLNIVSESSVTYSVLVSYASNVYTVTVSSTSSLTFTFFCFQSGYSVTVNGSTLTFSSQVATYAYSP